MILTPTYYVMEMYKVHQDAKLIPIKYDSPLYRYNGKAIPALSVSASKDSNGLVHISMVNVDAKKENKIEIDLNELGVKNVSGKILTSKKLQDYNSFDNPTKIQSVDYKGFKIKQGKLTVTIPPFSVIMIEGK
jgi:alpha-N-arabinofuranosidase